MVLRVKESERKGARLKPSSGEAPVRFWLSLFMKGFLARTYIMADSPCPRSCKEHSNRTGPKEQEDRESKRTELTLYVNGTGLSFFRFFISATHSYVS